MLGNGHISTSHIVKMLMFSTAEHRSDKLMTKEGYTKILSFIISGEEFLGYGMAILVI